MGTRSVETQTKQIIARLVRVDENAIDTRKRPAAYGVDSLGLLVLRENLERSLQVVIPDDDWLDLESIGDLIACLSKARGAQPVAVEAAAGETAARTPAAHGRRLTSKGVMLDELEVGMPLTGLMNLAESPLLKVLGDLRWAHLSATCGVPSKAIADAEGHRLYPTFFYVDMLFPDDRPMASYGENDVMRLASTLGRYGGSMLDGIVYLLPEDALTTDRAPFSGSEAAVAAGVPAVRMSNIFVMQYDGAEWLKKSRPANTGFEAVPELATPPDSYLLTKQAEKDGAFARPGPDHVRMVDETVTLEHGIVADRDLNGAGLVYFANYPVFLDVCERKALLGARLPLPPELLDRRTIVRRQSAYLNNASSRDTLRVGIDPWVHNPVLAGHPEPEMAPIRLFINYRMTRKSDGRVMMISTARKLIFGRPLEQAPFAAELLRMARS